MMDSCYEEAAWTIEDGVSINFWHDHWLHNSILLKSSTSNFHMKIAYVISQVKWCLPDLFFKTFPHLQGSIRQII